VVIGTTLSGGTVIQTIVVSSGQTVSGLVINSDTILDVAGTAIGTVIEGDGTVYVDNGGIAEDTRISAAGPPGFLYVSSGGVAISTIVSGGGSLDLDGGIASDTTLIGGSTNFAYLYVGSGGTATSTTLGSGGTESVGSSGLDMSAVIGSGGYLTVDFGGSATSATVDAGGTLTVAQGGNATGTVQHGGGVVNNLPCFAAGTLILTENGPVPVEQLSVGDRVLTIEGSAEPIVWIGARTIDCQRHARPEQVQPVRIRADAFGPNAPSRDLFLSPDHAVFTEGVLIPVKHLVNGGSVRQVDAARVTYVHLELPRHSVIVAEGLAAESYLDTGDRAAFIGDRPVITLHPVFGYECPDAALVMESLGYAPLRVTGPEVSTVRARLAACSKRQEPHTSQVDVVRRANCNP
jgi:autotransporter passenger strand-loop-strand repeat protein